MYVSVCVTERDYRLTSLAQAFHMMPNPSRMVKHGSGVQLYFLCISKEVVWRPEIRFGRVLGSWNTRIGLGVSKV